MPNSDADARELYAAWSSHHDRDALERLLALKLPLVFRVAVRFVFNSHDAEDVTQQVLLRFSQARAGSIRELDRWLYVATVRAARDFLRSAGSRQQREHKEARMPHSTSAAQT